MVVSTPGLSRIRTHNVSGDRQTKYLVMHQVFQFVCIFNDIFHLIDKVNKASLENIQRSIFVLCLDEHLPSDMSDERSVAARLMLHGGGSKLNTGNRWFDKTIQVLYLYYICIIFVLYLYYICIIFVLYLYFFIVLFCLLTGFQVITELRRKSKDLLGRNQDNVSKWNDMFTCELLFQ